MKRVVVPLLAMLALGLGTLPPASGQIMGDEPTIVSLVPTEAALGQVFTIQGFNLFDPAHPELTEVRLTEKATGKTITTQPLAGPTSAEAVYVRFPTGLPLGTWMVRVAILGGATSNQVGLQLKSKPGTPIPRAVLDPQTLLPITQVRRGQTVAIQAYGVDLVPGNLVAVWSQSGVLPKQASDDQPKGDPIHGIASQFVMPADLAVAIPALVQLKLTIAGVASNLSFALRVQVIE